MSDSAYTLAELLIAAGSEAWRGDAPATHSLLAAGAAVDLHDGESGW